MHATPASPTHPRISVFARWLPLALAILLPQAQAAPANPAGFNALAQAIDQFKQDTRYPAGTAVIVVKDGKIAYQGYFGFADIAAKTPVDAETVFYIASATKPFFALNALLAQDAGRLDTGTTLQAMFPDAHFSEVDPSAVTLRHLLTHTSGIDNVALGWATAFSGVHDATSRQRLVLQSRPNAESPLGTFDYTNIGYNIASEWLDRIDPGAHRRVKGLRLVTAFGIAALVGDAQGRQQFFVLDEEVRVSLKVRRDSSGLQAFTRGSVCGYLRLIGH